MPYRLPDVQRASYHPCWHAV